VCLQLSQELEQPQGDCFVSKLGRPSNRRYLSDARETNCRAATPGRKAILIRLRKGLVEKNAGTGLGRLEADDPTSGQEVRDRIFSSFQSDSNPCLKPAGRLVQSDAGLSGSTWLHGNSGCSIRH
jgi:hypothetical protein